VNSAPLSDAVGGAFGGVAVFQDISPLRDLERQKDEFLASVSHDLKTPATIIMGRANLLSRALRRAGGATEDELTDGLQAIDESTVQLVRLVDELLDVTRMRMGQAVTLDLGAADLVKIVRRLGQEYQKLHATHPIEIVTSVSSLVGDWDEARVERVVANLFSNAIKYSPAGRKIRVVTSEEGDEDHAWAVLTVEDHGIGIRPDEVGRVFEPYFRGSNVPRSAGGTGVGLAGTRHIVEQHEGTISVRSTLGEGTTFTVRLPLIREPIDPFDLVAPIESNGTDHAEAGERRGPADTEAPKPVASVPR
jgi:signal transduction histidine kinase